MRSILSGVALGGLLALAPMAVLADDVALILSESDYRHIADNRAGARLRQLEPVLEERGFQVFGGINLDAADSWAAVERFRDSARSADRVLIILAGHVVSSQREVWLLTRFARNPTDLSIGANAVPLGPILDLAGEHPGQAVVMVAPSKRDIVLSDQLVRGVELDELPQGVTLVTGPAAAVIDLARDVVLQPGSALATNLTDPRRGVTVAGFVSDAVPFLPDNSVGPDLDNETAFWNVVQTMGSVDAYLAYASRYPDGRYLALANDAIAALRADPERRAREAEEALGLTRAQRQEIQRNLALLGYDPHGIDGIFGSGSRGAIRDFQETKGFVSTGYLTRNQIAALDTAAAVRARELEEEAERRRAEEERRDAAYWRGTGRNGSEAGLRAYLERYPDGLYSDLAQARLDDIEEAKRAAAAAEERAAWDVAKADDRARAYRDYLSRYPNGAFAEAAKARLDELEEDTARADERAAAKAEEARVAGNQVVRLLVENRLAALGYELDAVDGSFDKSTRRAIRKFQRSRGLSVTGFVTQETMVRLLVSR